MLKQNNNNKNNQKIVFMEKEFLVSEKIHGTIFIAVMSRRCYFQIGKRIPQIEWNAVNDYSRPK